jgi:hypothetical protein
MTVSTVIGVIAFWRFAVSDEFLARVRVNMEEKGKVSTPEQCVDEVVRHAATCEAMKSMCEATAPQWMEACLHGRDRTSYCASLGDATMSTSFGFAACKERHVDRRTKKACASAYRSIAAHCQSLTRNRQWVSSSSPSSP